VLNLVKKAIILIIGSPAAALFVWVVNPANVSGPTGVLNFPAVYTLWQFIRDFFNLFFIFILLFSAFATIFQVDSFNIRNIFKNVLLAALLINFSFPITRFLIDVANVPMYYFINDVIGAGGGQGAVTAMNNLLGFSGMSGAALTNGYIDTFAGIIFAFLFSVSLAVLSVMLIVRLVALTLLLIFSPIGFASALVPGLSKYGQEWWSKFWSYALFGPAAALMLVVSLKFLEATQAANVWRSVNEVSTNASVSGEGSTLITNVIFSTIPVILLWTTIGLANKFSVAGAATVVGMGYGASKWAGKKFSGYNAIKRRVDSYTAERKKRQDAKNRDNIGSRLGSGLNQQQDRALAALGSKTAAGRVKDYHNKAVYEQADENKKNGISDSDLKLQLTSGDKVKAAAAAISLSERKAISSADEFSAALKALGNNTKEVAALIDRSGGSAMRDMDLAQYQAVKASGVISGNANLEKQLDSQLKKEGNAKVLVEHKINTTPGITRDAAVSSVLGDIKSVKEQVKQESLFTDPAFNAEIQRYVTGLGLQRRTELEKAAAQESQDVADVLARIP
jgi:hypothetical protein